MRHLQQVPGESTSAMRSTQLVFLTVARSVCEMYIRWLKVGYIERKSRNMLVWLREREREIYFAPDLCLPYLTSLNMRIRWSRLRQSRILYIYIYMYPDENIHHDDFLSQDLFGGFDSP